MNIITSVNLVDTEEEPTIVVKMTKEDKERFAKKSNKHEWKMMPRIPSHNRTRGGESNYKCKRCGKEIYTSYACLPSHGCKGE